METLIGCAGGPDTISGWMRTNVRTLYIFTRNQFASYLLSSGFEQLLPAFPAQGFVAGLLAEAATRLLSAGWRAWQRHRAEKLLASKAPPTRLPAGLPPDGPPGCATGSS